MAIGRVSEVHDVTDAELDKVRLYLRLAFRWAWLSSGQYGHGAHQVAEVQRAGRRRGEAETGLARCGHGEEPLGRDDAGEPRVVPGSARRSRAEPTGARHLRGAWFRGEGMIVLGVDPGSRLVGRTVEEARAQAVALPPWSS